MSGQWSPGVVLFDFDGTLADSEPVITASLVHALGTEGFEVTAAQVRDVFGPPLQTMAQMLAGELAPERYERVRIAYFTDFNAQLHTIQPLPGAVEILDALDARAIPFGMVTNKTEASAAAQLAAMGWERRFATVVGADSVREPKPAAEPALLALERLGIAAERAAFVGDQEPDMLCATAAGIPVVIGLAHARAAEMLAAAGATYVAKTLHEVEAVLLRGDSICA